MRSKTIKMALFALAVHSGAAFASDTGEDTAQAYFKTLPAGEQEELKKVIRTSHGVRRVRVDLLYLLAKKDTQGAIRLLKKTYALPDEQARDLAQVIVLLYGMQ